MPINLAKNYDRSRNLIGHPESTPSVHSKGYKRLSFLHFFDLYVHHPELNNNVH